MTILVNEITATMGANGCVTMMPTATTKKNNDADDGDGDGDDDDDDDADDDKDDDDKDDDDGDGGADGVSDGDGSDLTVSRALAERSSENMPLVCGYSPGCTLSTCSPRMINGGGTYQEQ